MTTLPVTLDGLHDLPIAARGVYEYDQRGYYRLTAGGVVLSQVRDALREGFVRNIRVSANVSLPDWTSTMSAATAPERKELMKLMSANAVRIVR